MDFIMQLPESQGKTQIIVVVDRFTKMADFMGLHENATAKDVAATFLREVWKLNGPTEIISDMDAKFPGELCESLCKMLGVQRRCQWRIPLTRPDIWKNQPSAGRLLTNICQLRSGRLLPIIAIS